MKSKEKLYRTTSYWVEKTQNTLYRDLSEYMKKNNLNQNDLADQLKVTKGYISQVLNGKFNHSYKKLAELYLAIGLTPEIRTQPIETYITDHKKPLEAIVIRFDDYVIKSNLIMKTGISELTREETNINSEINLAKVV